MKTRSFSLWKILVCALVAYVFIFSIPAHLTANLQRMATEKYIEQFNSDGAVIDKFSHAFVNENLKDYLPYDYDLLEGLYKKFELSSGNTLDKARQPHNRHWRRYHLSVLINYEIDRLASSMINNTIWVRYILYILFVILGSILTYFLIAKQLIQSNNSPNTLSKFKKKNYILKSLITALLILGFWLTTLFYNSNGWRIQLLKGDSLVIIEIGFLLGFILFGISGYLIYLLMDFLKNSKSKWIIKSIDWLILILTIAVSSLILFHKDLYYWGVIRSIIPKSYEMLLSENIVSYVGIERFLAFGFIVIFYVLAVITLLYLFYRILIPRDNEFRTVSILKHYGIILSICGALFVLSSNIAANQNMIETQNRKSIKSNTITNLDKIDAEVYQWFHQQQKDGETNTIPEEFINQLQLNNDYDFSYSWDGVLLETKIQYEQIDGEVITITHNLNAETSELNTQ